MNFYTVIENTPGYLPESSPRVYLDRDAALSDARLTVTELMDAGYELVAATESPAYEARFDLTIYYARCERPDTVAPDLGRVVTVESLAAFTGVCPVCDAARPIVAHDEVNVRCIACKASGPPEEFGLE